MRRIAIHSVPRSGSSWLGQIFNSSSKTCFRFQPLFSYIFKGYLNENSSTDDIHSFFRKIFKSSDEFLLQTDKVEKGYYPSFLKDNNSTHIVYKEVRYHNIIRNMLSKDNDLIVYAIIRNPYAVINSFLESPKEFRRDLGWNEIQEWQFANKKNLNKPEEFFGYEKWKEVYFMFKDLEKDFNDRFCLIYYDNLLKHTNDEVARIFNFCDLDLSSQTIEFIKKSKSSNIKEPYSVYKNKINDKSWMNNLSKEISSLISSDLKKSEITEFPIDI